MKNIFIHILFLLLFGPLVAQQFHFDHLGVKDGLESNRIFMTIEDSEGFMWIASERGINRFDGRTLRSYSLGDIEGVRQGTNVTPSLGIDSQGTLWLILSNGLIFYYNKGLDQFAFFDQIRTQDGEDVYVGKFHLDHKDHFIIGSFSSALVYAPDTKSIDLLDEISTTVKSIIQSADHRYFIGSRDGVAVYDKNLNYLFNLKDKEVNGKWMPDNQRIESLYLQESENKLWIGFYSAGLHFYDLTHNQFSSSNELLENIDLPIRDITDFGGGKLMIGTDGGGIFMYDSFTSKVIDQLVADEFDENALNSNAIYDISVNSQGVFFISTFRGGVNIYNPNRQNFSILKHNKGEKNSLRNNIVYSIAEVQPGKISFGTDKGISFWQKSSNTWSHLSLDPANKENKNEVAWSQALDNKGDLWVASFIYSLRKFGSQDEGFVLKEGRPAFLQNAIIKKVYTHPSGEILLGSINSGLFLVSDSGKVTSYPIQEAIDFETYSSEKVIMCGRDGIAMLDLAFQEVTWMNKGLIGQTLENESIVSLLIDKDRNLWVGTLDHGIFVFNTNLTTVRALNTQTGLASNQIFDLISDADQNVWVVTGEGISKVVGETLFNYYKSDGIASIDFNRNTAIRDQEGNLYFGTNQGVITFDPLSLRPSEINKKLVLNDFYLNHERIVPGEGAVLSQPLNQTSSLCLSHNQNSFSIGFSSIDFVHPEQGEYIWKLEGFHPEWVANQSQDQATYTNLNPGTYTFRLRLIDQLGKLLAPESKIELVIVKPYWQTNLAYILYALIVLAVLGLLFYAYRLRMESRNAEDRLHFLIEMAHEIKTPLTLIKASINDSLQNREIDKHTQESLGVALKSADKLQKQMMQFLDFKRTNVRKNSLQIESVDLIELIDVKLYAFKVLAERKQIDLAFHHDQESFIIKSDEKILDKIISNLISNAIKYTPEKGFINLSLQVSPNNWELSVKDNGIGVSKEDQKKIFTLFYRAENAKTSGSTGSGVGLVLANDLAKTLDGSVKLAHSGRNGSEFILSMPITEMVRADEFVQEKETAKIEAKRIEEEVLKSAEVKILLVEDDDEFRQYQKQKFEPKYHILTASNGEEALKVIEATPPDLIISDVKMPRMDGRQLCMAIKSNLATSHIPFILLTGLESREHVQEGFASGADDYISKPFDFDILVTKIDNLLHTRAAFKDRFVSSEEKYVYQDLSNELDQHFLDNITNLVEDNISDPELSIIFICQSMGMSRTSFYHKLKSLVDMSPSEFIRTIRLKRARKLLLNPSYNISEVAYSAGFSDAKYFSTLFKKYYKQSPSSFIAEKRTSITDTE